VPGGIAEKDGRLFPGDRLMFVNDINLENSTLEEAVEALKGAPSGMVRIGVAKPLPVRTWILLISCIYAREMAEESRIVI
jgi:multiple PDZ domain protein